MIHAGNVDQIRAPIIAELANGPVEGEVDEELQGRGTTVLPDVLANAGGVTVSYFEWVQNRQGYPWTLETVRQRLEETLLGSFDEIWSIHEEKGLSLRDAAYGLALSRLGEAVEAHGTRRYFSGGD